MEDGDRELRGTEITLFLGDEGTEFLNGPKIQETLDKYCSVMPYPIFFKDLSEEPKKDEEGNVIIEEPTPLNDVSPLYMKRPGECTDEEYKEFYQKHLKILKSHYSGST